MLASGGIAEGQADPLGLGAICTVVNGVSTILPAKHSQLSGCSTSYNVRICSVTLLVKQCSALLQTVLCPCLQDGRGIRFCRTYKAEVIAQCHPGYIAV